MHACKSRDEASQEPRKDGHVQVFIYGGNSHEEYFFSKTCRHIIQLPTVKSGHAVIQFRYIKLAL
jgi:hypothetical protein